MSTILGLGLIIVSVYFLGQNIIFNTHLYSSWLQKTSATASVLALLAGVGSLTFWRRELGNFGWFFIAIGIILVFLNSAVILQPTSLWTFVVAMLAFASGYQLLTSGRIRF
ncbi:hypothetical protein [Chamaesiphon sp. OTE_20_metabat_361]|uniref:hypothetical protein n=1 Tax=Chamaesiphon sp. OTE_20_metabat_361 TaxID=2964689 RepID=UPI00286CC4EC|nr:hypothetical protein [Chamaesiphon sp. OTE_20_metabat_361]